MPATIGCWCPSASVGVARRKFLELADIATSRRREHTAPISPIAFEAITRIDKLFDIEREIMVPLPGSAGRRESKLAELCPRTGSYESSGFGSILNSGWDMMA